MTVFVPESIKVLGSDAGGASVVLCEMYVDTLADLPAPDTFTGFRLSMGCKATVINDNSRHRINSAGQWVQIAAGTSTYTRSEIDTMIAAIDAENANQQTEINYLINTGAKNLLNVTASSGVLNTATIDIADDGSIHISGQPTSNGEYVISSGIDLVIPENAYILSMGAEAGDTKMALSLRRKGTTQYVDLYHAESRIIPSGTYDRAHIYLYSDTDYDTTVYPMILPAAITDSTFEPYSPTNRQLYEMILQLQGG